MFSRRSLLPLTAGLALACTVIPASANESDYSPGGSIAIDARICETAPVNPLDCPAAPGTGPLTLVAEAGDVFLTMDEATSHGGALVWGEAGNVPLTTYFIETSYLEAPAGYALWNLVPGAGANGGGSEYGYFVSLSEEQPTANLSFVYVPNEVDSDGDGATDDVEVSWGSDPYDSSDFPVVQGGPEPGDDSDGDGATNAEENVFGSDPFDPSDFPVIQAGPEPGVDTDGDYLDDIAEGEWGTDLNNPDSDGDGAHDGIETAYGSDPMNADDHPAPASAETGGTSNASSSDAVVATTLPNTGAGTADDGAAADLMAAVALAGALALGGVAVARQRGRA